MLGGGEDFVIGRDSQQTSLHRQIIVKLWLSAFFKVILTLQGYKGMKGV